MKFYGYPIDISDQDLAYKQCFVASTSTANFDESQAIPTLGLSKTNTRGSINSTTSTASKEERFVWFQEIIRIGHECQCQ